MINFLDTRLPERFWRHVHPCPMSGCWLWSASVTAKGYGLFFFGGRTTTAHRTAFLSLGGHIPPGLVLDHLCRVRCCVNPAHMEPVTNATNVRRGVLPTELGHNRRKTHCPRGHAYAGSNLTINNRGERQCRECNRARMRVA